MILLRGIVSLLGFLLLLVLAVAGLALAVFSVQAGDGTLSPATLADALRLHELRDSVDGSLSDLESGASDLPALLIGLGVIAIGVLLLLGVFVPSRERLVTLAHEDGQLGARRRPLAQVARALAERRDGITTAKAKVKPGRRRGGRVKLRADRTREADASAVRKDIERELSPLSESFGLKTRVSTRLADRGSRVQ